MNGIDQQEALARLCAIDTKFKKLCDELTAEMGDEAWRLAWMEYGDILIERYRSEGVASLGQFIDLLEHLIVHGNQSVQESVATEVLESLLTESDKHKEEMLPLIQALGPESKDYMRAYDKFQGIESHY